MKKILGFGTYGKVAKDVNNPAIAIKSVHFENMFSIIREVVLLNSINHPNIIKIHATSFDFVKFHINMEMDCYDKDLDAFIDSKEYLECADVDDLIVQLFSGMSYLHQNNIIHRDITPGNVLIKRVTKSSYKLVLCDFGLAVKKWSPSQTFLETKVCTRTYRAPEIYLGVKYLKYDEKVDIWSFGCVVYYLLTGEELMDWTTYHRKFAKLRQEASRYVCHLYNLPDYRNHLTRLKVFRYITPEYLKEFYLKRLNDSFVAVNLIDKYLNLLVKCLHPDASQRSFAVELNYIVDSHVPHTVEIHSMITSANISLLEYKATLPNDVLIQNIQERLDGTVVQELGTLIWNRFRNRESVTNIFYVGCMYIAALLLESKEDDFLEKCLSKSTDSPIKFTFVLYYIMYHIDWQIPDGSNTI